MDQIIRIRNVIIIRTLFFIIKATNLIRFINENLTLFLIDDIVDLIISLTLDLGFFFINIFKLTEWNTTHSILSRTSNSFYKIFNKITTFSYLIWRLIGNFLKITIDFAIFAISYFDNEIQMAAEYNGINNDIEYIRTYNIDLNIQNVFRFINFLFLLNAINRSISQVSDIDLEDYDSNPVDSDDDENTTKENRIIKYVPNIPGKKIYESETNETVCTICYESKCDWSLNCNHQYHFNCIKEWYINRNKNSCPYCRCSIHFISSPE